MSPASVRDSSETLHSIGHVTVEDPRCDALQRLESHPYHQGLQFEESEKPTATAQDEDNKDGKIMGRTKGKIAVIMLALCLAVFLAALDVTIITTAVSIEQWSLMNRDTNTELYFAAPHHQRAFPLIGWLHLDWFRLPACERSLDSIMGQGIRHLWSKAHVAACKHHLHDRIAGGSLVE